MSIAQTIPPNMAVVRTGGSIVPRLAVVSARRTLLRWAP